MRARIEVFAELDQPRRLDHASIEGYRRNPTTASESAAAIASLREAIAEESW